MEGFVDQSVVVKDVLIIINLNKSENLLSKRPKKLIHLHLRINTKMLIQKMDKNNFIHEVADVLKYDVTETTANALKWV